MVDVDAVLKILVATLVVGVGLTALFGKGAVALGRMRRDHRTGALLANGLLLALVALACAAALAAGFIAMTHK